MTEYKGIGQNVFQFSGNMKARKDSKNKLGVRAINRLGGREKQREDFQNKADDEKKGKYPMPLL